MQKNRMEKVLEYFTIDGAVGGSQAWFHNVVMYMGGCAAATACDSSIYFALHKGWTNLYPFDIHHLTKEEYVRFAMKMKPYLKPRVGGVKKPSMFIEGYAAYLKDVGNKTLHMEAFEGEHSDEEAEHYIKQQIDRGYPVPYLMLRHQDARYKDFEWHWFLCYGYEIRDNRMWIAVATYGQKSMLPLQELWNTGWEEKGGMIGFY